VPGATRHSQREFSLSPEEPGSWRTLLLWLMLSHIGSDVLDEWVFSFQGAGGLKKPLTYLLVKKIKIVA
jgi:hypothetical protein